jgi:hypothetical protein
VFRLKRKKYRFNTNGTTLTNDTNQVVEKRRMAKDSNGFVKKKIFVFLICFGSENFFEVYIKVITEKCPEKP